jgi:hypothetical protein
MSSRFVCIGAGVPDSVVAGDSGIRCVREKQLLHPANVSGYNGLHFLDGRRRS